jgi:tRNA (cytidine32/uridine32-2'-O)-methyltransferase
MVETSHPGNIGAAARAMKNMSLSQLSLVNPKSFPDAAAVVRASGATDILDAAMVFTSVDEALQGAHIVIGASARIRSLKWPQIDAEECARLVLSQTPQANVAIMFGRENSGLTNEELERCNYLLHIPTNKAFSSLNVAAAVQIVAYELSKQSQSEIQPDRTTDSEIVLADEMRLFYQHLEQTLIDLEFLNPDNPRQLMRRLRRLFNRATLEKVEVNILRGILSAAQQRKKSLK